MVGSMAVNGLRSDLAAHRPRLCALLLFSYALCALSFPTVFFVDSTKGPYLRSEASPSSSTGALSVQVLAAVDTSLLGIPPPLPINADLSQRIGALISSDVFNRPRAVLAVTLAGIDAEDPHVGNLTAALSSGGRTRSAVLASPDPGAVLGAVQLVASAARGGRGRIRILHPSSTPSCGEACQELSLEQALAAAGARYEAGADPLTGTVSFGSSSFLLSEPDLRVWAGEVAGLWGATREFLTEVEDEHVGGLPTLLESTMLGLQLARADQGASSAEFFDLVSLTGAVLGNVHLRLEGALDGRLVLQIGLLGSAEAAPQEGMGLSIEEMAEITVAHRRRLLEDSTGADVGVSRTNTEVSVAQFSTKAAGIGTFMLLLFTTLGAMYCMVNMPVRQDTLLYSRTKVD